MSEGWVFSDSGGVAGANKTYHVVANGNEEVEEPMEVNLFSISSCRLMTGRGKKIEWKDVHHPTFFHLHLHRPAPLERRPTPDDQSQVMCPQLRIIVRGIRIRISRARKNSTALYPRLQPLLPQRQPLQVVQAISIGGTIKHGIL